MRAGINDATIKTKEETAVKRLLVSLLVLVAIVSLAANVWLYKKYSSNRPVVRVGSDVVTLKEYRDNLDYKFGKAVLSKMTLAKIVNQAAQKAGVTASKADVDARIADIQRRTPAVLEAAMKDPVQMNELRQDLATDLAVENLIIKDVPASDTQAREFYAKNAALFAVPLQSQTLMATAANSVDANTAAALMRQKGTTGAMLATQPRIGVVGVTSQINWNAIPPKDRDNLSQAVNRTAIGGVSVVPVTGGFFVVRIDSRESAGTVPYEKIKGQVLRMARLQKGTPRDVKLAQLYRDAGVTVEMANYASFFSELNEAVRRLDSLPSSAGKPASKVSQAK